MNNLLSWYLPSLLKKIHNKDCYIYCLIEHQSSVCWQMPLRILDYQLSILKSHLEQYPKSKSLPIVIPLLVYNGKLSPYPLSLDIFELFDDMVLAKQTFCARARLVDLTIMPDQEIKQHHIISLLEFSQKHVRDKKILQQTIDDLVYIINKLDMYVNQQHIIAGGVWFKDYIELNLHYLYYFANIIDEKEFTSKLATVNFIQKENIMGTLARKIEQRGIEKGKVEGIQQGKAEGLVEGIQKGKKQTAKLMLQEGVDLNFISKITGLTLEEINQL